MDILADKVFKQEAVSLVDKAHKQRVCNDIAQYGYILCTEPLHP